MNPSGSRKLLPFCAIAASVLAFQVAMFYMLPKPVYRQLRQPLAELPAQLGDWVAARDNPMAPEVARVLMADDTLNRDYISPVHGSQANLFIAYFGTQEQARAPHSPQHCMPGSGWEPQLLTRVPVMIEGATAPVRVNRFILAKGTDQVVVHYWYESNGRVVASEYLAKMYLVLDSIRYRRSDTALVRVTVRVPNGGSVDTAIEDGMRFVRTCLAPVRAVLD